MGWNDSRIMDALFNKKTISIFLGITIIFTLAYSQSLNAFVDKENKEDIMTYRVDFWMPPTVRHHYSYTEKSDISRTYSDGSVMTYSREVTFFFDVKAPNPEKDGFLTLNISIDSMHYKYVKGDYTYSYNSQGDLPGNFGLQDYTANAVSLSKFFNVTYSPYGNISKLEGEELEMHRESIKNKKDSFKPVDYYLWSVGAASPRLIQITDMKKIQYPAFRLAEDSTFKSPLFIQLNHIDLKDTVEMTLNEVSSGMMYFSGNFNNPEMLTRTARFEDITDQLVEIDNVKAKGRIASELTPRGTPDKTEIDITMEVSGKINREIFSEVVKSKMVWQLLGQWEY